MNVPKIFDARSWPRYVKKAGILSVQGFSDRRDARRLDPLLHLNDFQEIVGVARHRLQPFYQEYIAEVSGYDFAISLELAAFLVGLCTVIKPKSIVDLGSGFSSFALRFYRQGASVTPTVWSVDDSPAWLSRTRAFLARHSLFSENTEEWPVFSQRQPKHMFDLVLHDLGSMRTREETLPAAVDLVAPGGVIVLDDMHQFDYAMHAKQWLAKAKLGYYSLGSFTKDKHGRYAYLVRL